jgi:hypothetical protein
VTIWGEQFTDGTVERGINAECHCEDMRTTEDGVEEVGIDYQEFSAEAARRIAAALAEAAAEVEKLAGP